MRWRPWLVGLLGLVTLAIYVTRYPLSVPATVPLTLPQADKLGAALRSLALLFLVDLAALAVGGPLWSRLRPRGRSDDLAAPVRLAFGLLVLGTAVLLLAALHLLSWPVLAALLIVPIAVRARILTAEARLCWKRSTRSGSVAALVLAAGASVAPLLCAFVPYYGWDSLTYHLALPERYLFWNRIWVTPCSLFTVFPLAVEMLYTLALGLDGPALAKLVHLQFGLLTLLVAYRLARRRSARAGLLAVALLVGDPLFGWELTVSYSDLAVCLYALLAAAALADWRRHGDPPLLARAALLAGACVAVKYPGAAVPTALGVWLVVAGGGTLGHRVGAAVVFGLWSAGPFVPWLVRNWVFAGNPFAPLLQTLFNGRGREYFTPLVLDQILVFNRNTGMGRSLGALLMLPWNLLMHTVPGVYGNSFGFQIGPLWGVTAVAALALGEVRRDRLVAVLLPVSGLLAILWFLGVQDTRLLLPALALLAVVGGLAFDTLVAPHASWGRLLLVLPLCAAVHGLWHGAENLAWYYGYGLGALDRAALEERDPAARAGRVLRASSVPGDRVLLLFESRGWLFRGLDYVPAVLNEGSEVLQLVHRAADVHDLRCRLDAMGVTQIVVNENNVQKFPATFVSGYGPADFEQDQARVRALLADWGIPLMSSGGVVAARLRSAPDCDP